MIGMQLSCELCPADALLSKLTLTCMQKCWGSAEQCPSQRQSASSNRPARIWGPQGSGQYQGMSGTALHRHLGGSCMFALGTRGTRCHHTAHLAHSPCVGT